MGGNAHLRRENFDEVADAHQRGPALADMAIEAEGFVLRENEHTAQVAVEAVREGDVDDAVNGAKGHGGLGAIARQRPQALALAASQEHANRIFHQGHNQPSLSATHPF